MKRTMKRTMKCYASGLIAVMAIALLTDLSYAQPPEGGGRGGRGGIGGPGGGGEGGRGGAFGGGRVGGRGGFGGGPEQMMKMFPLMIALDANKDGVISSEEIDGAVIALKKLDKDKNGKLEGSELMPDMFAIMRSRGGFGRPGGGGEGRPRRPGEDGPGAGRGREGRPGAGPGGPGGRPDVAAFLDRMFGPDGIDENKDKKLSKDELPERMQELFASADADEDGFLSRAEVEKLLQARWKAAGGRGRDGDGGGAEGDRPRRPQRPAVEDDDE
jgi:hypothetical protein